MLGQLFGTINARYASWLRRLNEESGLKKTSKWWFFDPDRPDAEAGSPMGGMSALIIDENDMSGGLWGGSSDNPSSVLSPIITGEKGMHPDTSVLDDGSGAITPGPVINQQDILTDVLLPLAAPQGEKGVDTVFLTAVAVEYLRSLSTHGISVEAGVFELIIDLFCRSSPPRFHMLHQFLQYHVIHDSKQVAAKLLELEPQYPQVQQLVLDMFFRLRQSSDAVDLLLQRRNIHAAIEFVRKHKIKPIKPGAFLQVAMTDESGRLLNDTELLRKTPELYHVLQFLEAYNQAYRHSPEFVPEDGCDELVAKLRSIFGSSETQD
jgi:hypothetical protein